MDILKELNLNKTPNTVKDYSLVGAKNVMVDPTGSFITSEDGFSVMFRCSSRVDEKIVGVIPCNEEIVVFTYSKQYDESFVYRKFDKDDSTKACRMNTKWKWHGGKIVGSFIYNYKDQLIIIVGEYDKDNPDKQIPLLSWVMPDVTTDDNGDYVSGEDTYVDYKIAPDITPYQCKYSIDNGGSLICGTYTFFIRFENYKDTYTKWFQITDDINIYDLVDKENPKLFQMLHGNHADSVSGMDGLEIPDGVAYKETEGDGMIKLYNAYEGNSSDTTFLINSFKTSSNMIKLYISLDRTGNTDKDGNSVDFKRFQIGYIYKREATNVGRILNTYDISYGSTNVIPVVDNKYLEEESIDEFTKQPIQFYNVKNIYFYNKRVYIANYETQRELYTEYNEQMTELFKGVHFNVDTDNAADIYGINGAASSSTSGKKWTRGYIDISLNFVYNDFESSFGVSNVAYTVKDKIYYIDNSADFLTKLFNNIGVCDFNSQYVLTDQPEYEYIEYHNDRNKPKRTGVRYWYLAIAGDNSDTEDDFNILYKNYDSSFVNNILNNAVVYIKDETLYIEYDNNVIELFNVLDKAKEIYFKYFAKYAKNESISAIESNKDKERVSIASNEWVEPHYNRIGIQYTAFQMARMWGNKMIKVYTSYNDNPIYEETSSDEAVERGYIDISFNYELNGETKTCTVQKVAYDVKDGVKYITNNVEFTKALCNTLQTPNVTLFDGTSVPATIATKITLDAVTQKYYAFELGLLKDNSSLDDNGCYNYSKFHTLYDGHEGYTETDLVWYIKDNVLYATCEADDKSSFTIGNSESAAKIFSIGRFYWSTYWDTDVYYYYNVDNTGNWGPEISGNAKEEPTFQVMLTSDELLKMWISLDNDQSISDDTDDDSTDNGNSNINNSVLRNQHNRTLLPYQCYKFYIHLIRRDGSVTDGYEIDNVDLSRDNIEIVKTKYGAAYKITKLLSNLSNRNGVILVPNFTKLSYPTDNTDSFADTFKEEYIGYFFTYEEIEREVNFVKCFKHYVSRNLDGSNISAPISSLNTKSFLNNSEILYGEEYPAITKLIELATGNKTSIDRTTVSKTVYTEKHLTTLTTINNDDGTLFATVETTDNIYNKQVKTLYRLTQNYYFGKSVKFNTSNYYLPGFFCEDILFYFTQPVATSISALTMQDENNIDSTFTIKKHTGWTYSKVPYYCLSVKTDYLENANSYTQVEGSDTYNVGIKTNRSFLTTNLQDFLELKENYSADPNVVYTNYNEKYVTTFPYTVFRSNEFADESLTNAFSQFEVDQYKIISENKGEITNLTSIGLKFFVHTKYSLFVFDRSPVLTSTASTKIPDTFDCDYKEVTMDKIGGLEDNDQCINTTIGYVWFDSKNRYIFIYKDKAAILSKDINSFIKAASIERVLFANDKGNNRLLMSLFSSDDKLFTLSFNLLTGTFISLHDYVIMKSYDTLNINYIFSSHNAPDTMPTDSTKRYNNQLLFRYNKNNNTYKQLRYTGDEVFDKYVSYVDTKLDDAGIDRYVDIIVNTDYELTKSIEAIHYILNKINGDFDLVNFKNIAEEDLGRRYSGDKMIVYNSECTTDELDINTDNNTNVLNNYKYPYWSKGQWNFNYFRNNIGTGTKPTLSDMNSVIYGKYFVIRFIFNYDIRFKLERLTIDTNPY